MPMRKWLRVLWLIVSATATLLAFGSSPALAHNTFVESSPAEGELLESPPTTWTVTFEKSVPLDSASGVVVNGDGVRTALSTPRHGTTDSTIIFDLPPNLNGAISARWRLVGVDGHVISGRVSFTVQTTASELPASSDSSGLVDSSTSTAEIPVDELIPEELLLDDEPSMTPEPIRVVLRLAGFIFLLLLGGVFFVELSLAQQTIMVPTGTRFVRIGAWGSAIVPLVQLWTLSNDVGGSFSDVLSLTPGGMVLTKSLAGFSLVAGSEMVIRRRTRFSSVQWQLCVAWVAYLVALAYGGHSRSQGLAWLGIPADVLHTSAVSAWLGGLAALIFVVLPSVDPHQGVACLKRFSLLAERSVIVVAVTGLIQTVRLHGSITTLFTSTHGMLLLLKIFLVGIIIRLAARNRKILRTTQESDSSSNTHTKSVLVRSALKETTIALVVLAVTAFLVGASLD